MKGSASPHKAKIVDPARAPARMLAQSALTMLGAVGMRHSRSLRGRTLRVNVALDRRPAPLDDRTATTRTTLLMRAHDDPLPGRTHGHSRVRAAHWVMALALAARLAWLALFYLHPALPGGESLFRRLIPSTWQSFYQDMRADRLFSDQMGFDALARHLLAGEGYRIHDDGPPTAFRPPVYPLFLVALYAPGGDDLLRVRVAQVLLETFTVGLVMAIARRVTRDARAALAAGVVCALYHPLIVFTATLFSETVYTFLLAVFVYALVRARERDAERTAPSGWERGRLSRYAGVGALLGLVTLTKPTTLLLPFFFLLPVLWRRDRAGFLRREGPPLLALAAGMALALAPWTARNYQLTGGFVPVTTGGGRAVWACNVVRSDDPMLPWAQQGVARDSAELDRRFYWVALRNIATHPAAFARTALVKGVRLWFNLGYPTPPSRGSLLIGVVNILLALGAVYAAARGGPAWRGRAGPLFLLMLYFSLVHMALVGYIRYALPVLPYLMVTGTYGASLGLAKARQAWPMQRSARSLTSARS